MRGLCGGQRDQADWVSSRRRPRRDGRSGVRDPAAAGDAERGFAGRRRVSGQTGRFPASRGGDEAPAAEQIRHEGGQRQSGLPLRRPARLQLRLFRDAANWDAYKQEMFVKQLANEAQMTAVMDNEAWDWGPWRW